MFKQLTYKSKLRYLFIGTGLILLLSWFLAIQKTIQLKNEVADLRLRSNQSSVSSSELASLQTRLANLDAIISKQGSGEVRERLLGVLTSYCQKNGILLKAFPETIIEKGNEASIETNVFTVEGAFIPLLKLLYTLEQKQRIGKVSSASYQTRIDPKTKKTLLSAVVYVQNVKTNSHE
jgi:hypothetical protein